MRVGLQRQGQGFFHAHALKIKHTHMLVNTLDDALCMTAIWPALGLVPSTSFRSSPVSGVLASLYTSTPSRISFQRMQEMLFVSARSRFRITRWLNGLT